MPQRGQQPTGSDKPVQPKFTPGTLNLVKHNRGVIGKTDLGKADELIREMTTLWGRFPREHLNIWDAQHATPVNERTVKELQHKDNQDHIAYNERRAQLVALGGPTFENAPPKAYDGMGKPKPVLKN